MNKHLNLFRFYTTNDKNHQLENDLTRALAITLLENNLFLHESLKEILTEEDFQYLSNQDLSQSNLEISIQRNTKQLRDFDKIYAVSISGEEMKLGDFYNLKEGYINNEITDMVIQINALEDTPNRKITIIFEVKRNNAIPVQQLFDQAISIYRNNINDFDFQEFKENELRNSLIVKDWSWKKVMRIAYQVQHFSKFTQNDSKVLNDFVDLVREHNIGWLPQFSLNVTPASQEQKIMERIQDALQKKFGQERLIPSRDRLGITLPEVPWQMNLFLGVIYVGFFRLSNAPSIQEIQKHKGICFF